MAISGILLVDKPSGMTSHDVVAQIRGIIGIHQVGHTGTLDPMATGLLPVCVGRATRAADAVLTGGKQYIAELQTGIETDTEDSTGIILRRSDKIVGSAELLKVLPRFTGRQMQMPPMYSAIKVGGVKLYKLARQGIEKKREPREITVDRIELINENPEEGKWTLVIDCSKGTYVRTLCADIGRELGCGGVMSSLRRTKTGEYDLKDAKTLDEIRELADRGELVQCLLPVDTVYKSLPEATADLWGENRVRHGASIPEGHYAAPDFSDSENCRIYGPGGFLGVGHRDENGALSCDINFFEVN